MTVDGSKSPEFVHEVKGKIHFDLRSILCKTAGWVGIQEDSYKKTASENVTTFSRPGRDAQQLITKC